MGNIFRLKNESIQPKDEIQRVRKTGAEEINIRDERGHSLSIVAILNKHQRGELLFGIGNDGIASGQTVTEKTLRDVSKSLSEHIEPKIYPKVEKIKINSRDCIKVEFHGEDIPYFAYEVFGGHNTYFLSNHKKVGQNSVVGRGRAMRTI